MTRENAKKPCVSFNGAAGEEREDDQEEARNENREKKGDEQNTLASGRCNAQRWKEERRAGWRAGTIMKILVTTVNTTRSGVFILRACVACARARACIDIDVDVFVDAISSVDER